MYIYQESWKSVLQPSTYTTLKRVQTRTILVLGTVLCLALCAVMYMGYDLTFDEWYLSPKGDKALFVLNVTYVLVLGGYTVQCISMTVLWALSYRFRRLLPPSHQPTVLGV
ncbi:hypothetical protein KIPB_014390, partial [Kipferlia bialata]|eukprot:g14390.t1